MNSESDSMTFEFSTMNWYSMGDEESFFRWLYSIPGYLTCKGKGNVLFVWFSKEEITTETVVELVSLFSRYKVANMTQLRQMESTKIGNMFSDPKNHWHKMVFADSQTTEE